MKYACKVGKEKKKKLPINTNIQSTRFMVHAEKAAVSDVLTEVKHYLLGLHASLCFIIPWKLSHLQYRLDFQVISRHHFVRLK